MREDRQLHEGAEDREHAVPGTMKRAVGLCTRTAAGAASRRGSSTASTRRRAGGSSIGNSRTSRFSFAARITISEANSIPVVRRSSARQHVAAQRAHAAVGVADGRRVNEVQEPGQDRVADPAEQSASRRAGCSSIRLPITSSAPSSSSRDEARDLVEVVGQVGVGHHDVVARRGGEAGQVGAAVAAARLVDHGRAGGARERRAAVLGAVVDDDHLAVELRGSRAPPGRA